MKKNAQQIEQEHTTQQNVQLGKRKEKKILIHTASELFWHFWGFFFFLDAVYSQNSPRTNCFDPGRKFVFPGWFSVEKKITGAREAILELGSFEFYFLKTHFFGMQ